MDALKELVNVVERNKVKSINVIGFNEGEKPTMANLFFQKIASGELKTDEEAAIYFFNASSSDISYRKLKSKLRTRLINTVFFLDAKQANYTEQDRAYVACWKEWAATKILFNRGAAKVGLELAHRILKKAQLFEFTDLALNICKLLLACYATRFPDLRKFEKYKRQKDFFLKQLLAETRAEELYFNLIVHYIQSQASQPEVAMEAEKYYTELAPLVREFPSFRLQRFFYQIKVASFICKNDFANTVLICNEALEVLESKPYQDSNSNTFFYFQKIMCHTQLKQYEEGMRIAEKSLAQEGPGSFNWFKNRQLAMFLAFHTGNYEKALDIFQKVTAQPGHKKLDPVSSETWKIFQAYLMYLVYTERIPAKSEHLPASFRLAKFLNEVPIYSRDKRGMNIPILIAQILFIISQNRYDLAIQRIDTIEKYCTRYLRHDDTYRSNVFIRMLLTIPQAGFHQIAVRRRAKRWLDLLEKAPLEYANQGHHIEIIPYEDLWEIVLDSLGSKIYSSPPSRTLPHASEPGKKGPK